MDEPAAVAWLPKPLGLLFALYFLASLVHVVHNAGYIAFYPTLPMWITPDRVYGLWLAVTGLGAAGLVAHRKGWPRTGAFLLVLYGACSLNGLAHFALPLCAQHNAVTTLTILLETGSGLWLAFASARRAWPRTRASRHC